MGVIAFFVFAVSSPALADDAYLGLQYANSIGLPSEDIRVAVAGFIRSCMGFLGLYLVLRIMWGGFLMMTHGGDEEARAVAMATIKNAAIGMVIVMSSASLTKFVVDAVTNAAGNSF